MPAPGSICKFNCLIHVLEILSKILEQSEAHKYRATIYLTPSINVNPLIVGNLRMCGSTKELIGTKHSFSEEAYYFSLNLKTSSEIRRAEVLLFSRSHCFCIYQRVIKSLLLLTLNKTKTVRLLSFSKSQYKKNSLRFDVLTCCFSLNLKYVHIAFVLARGLSKFCYDLP